jgi:peptide deformylase
MAIRLIRNEGDEILKKKAKPVKEISDSIKEVLDDMLETLRALDAVGIAAPQIGTLKRIVVVDFDDEIYELINPEIVEEEGNQNCNEACLSVPGRCGDVQRPFKIIVNYTDREGDEHSLVAEDFLASALCHEIDHLDGVLFLDKAKNIQVINEEQLRQRKRERKKRRAAKLLQKRGVYRK